jgi:hypothetical protein
MLFGGYEPYWLSMLTRHQIIEKPKTIRDEINNKIKFNVKQENKWKI